MYIPSVRVEEANPLCKTCKEANASDQYVMWYYDTPPPPAFNNILSAPWWSRENSDVVSATDDHPAVKKSGQWSLTHQQKSCPNFAAGQS